MAACSCRRRTAARPTSARTRRGCAMAEQTGREPASAFADRLRARFEGAEVDVAMPRGEVGIVFAPDAWHYGCRALRDEFGFEMLVDLCGIGRKSTRLNSSH